MSKTVYILRGPSGAGKSTYIQKNLEGIPVVSADHFFMNDGEYDFNPSLLAQAHNECLGRFISFVENGGDVVVDNTNIHIWEFANYDHIANMLGYKVVLVEFRVRTVEGIQKCAERNAHGVPADIVARMAMNFEPGNKGGYNLEIVTVEVD